MKEESPKTPAPAPAPVDLKQDESALLAGRFSEPLAIQDYRSGQHPDRGDGAKDPTEEQVSGRLEDFVSVIQISRLIRIYDSGEELGTRF